MLNRVVVTGTGLVTPLGVGTDHVWDQLVSGKSGIKKIDHCDVSDLPAQIAGIVPRGESPECLNPDSVLDKKEQKKVDDFILYALKATEEALESSGYKPSTDEEYERTGVMVGSGIGGLKIISDTSITLQEKGPRRISPFFIPSTLINLASGQISIKYGFKGPNHSVVTACATGTHAIGDAARLIAFGDADVMIAGGAENPVCRIGLAGFSAARALSTAYNDTPTEASRPWDQGRDGFVMGEGAGVVVLESYEHAKKRGANILAEIIGYGLSGDAYHITSPPEDGNGGFRAMQAALKRSGLSIEDIGYINAHGTSTPVGDAIEIKGVKKLFGDNTKIPMSSTKSAIGHLLGAAGAVECIFSILAMNRGIIPPTLNLYNPSEGCDLDLVPLMAKEKNDINAVVSNSFGFGGTNASVICKRI